MQGIYRHRLFKNSLITVVSGLHEPIYSGFFPPFDYRVVLVRTVPASIITSAISLWKFKINYKKAEKVGDMDADCFLTLLKEIELWENIVDGFSNDDGIDNSHLCRKYYDDKCRGCPIHENTGFTDCIDTPLTEWRNYQYDFNNWSGFRVFDATSKSLAAQFLYYLQRLVNKAIRRDQQNYH